MPKLIFRPNELLWSRLQKVPLPTTFVLPVWTNRATAFGCTCIVKYSSSYSRPNLSCSSLTVSVQTAGATTYLNLEEQITL